MPPHRCRIVLCRGVLAAVGGERTALPTTHYYRIGAALLLLTATAIITGPNPQHPGGGCGTQNEVATRAGATIYGEAVAHATLVLVAACGLLVPFPVTFPYRNFSDPIYPLAATREREEGGE